MNIIISPAKKMNVNNDDLVNEYKPVFMDKTNILYDKLKSLSYDELKKLLACNDDIAELNYDRYKYVFCGIFSGKTTVSNLSRSILKLQNAENGAKYIRR